MRLFHRDPFREKQDRYNYSNPWYTRITTRGVVVGVVLLVLLIALFTYATRDVCWIGTEAHPGYGSCSQQ